MLSQLKFLRMTQGIQQQQLARKIGVSNAFLCHIEAGDRPCPPRLQRKISRILGLPVKEIFPKVLEPENHELSVLLGAGTQNVKLPAKVDRKLKALSKMATKVYGDLRNQPITENNLEGPEK